MTEDRLELRGLRVLGRCGVPPEERRRPQPLEVDLDVHLDLGAAGRSDDLDDTVDYGGVCSAAERASDDRVQEVAVAVRKLRPPVASQLATAGVHLRRRR